MLTDHHRRRDGPAAGRGARRPGAYDLSSLIVVSSTGAILSGAVTRPAAGAAAEHDDPRQLRLHRVRLHRLGLAGSSPETGLRYQPNATSGLAVLDDELGPSSPAPARSARSPSAGTSPFGYYNDPDKTAATFVTSTAHALAAHRRPGHGRGGRHDHRLRPGLAVHQHRRREGLPRGGRGGAQGPPGGLRRGGGRRARRAVGRAGRGRGRSRAPAPGSPPPTSTRTAAPAVAGYKVPRTYVFVAEMVRSPAARPTTDGPRKCRRRSQAVSAVSQEDGRQVRPSRLVSQAARPR